MFFVAQLTTLAAVMLLACMSPGPDFIAITSNALASRRRGFGVALGASAACSVWSVLAIAGLGFLLMQIGWLYDAIRLLGAGYLVYLGIKILASARHSCAVLPIKTIQAVSRSAFGTGFLVGMTNPKSAAFFGSLFVTVLPVAAPLWVYCATLAIVFIVSLSWFTTLALAFSVERVRAVYAGARRPIDAVMGVVLVGLGLRLALTR